MMSKSYDDTVSFESLCDEITYYIYENYDEITNEITDKIKQKIQRVLDLRADSNTTDYDIKDDIVSWMNAYIGAFCFLTEDFDCSFLKYLFDIVLEYNNASYEKETILNLLENSFIFLRTYHDENRSYTKNCIRYEASYIMDLNKVEKLFLDIIKYFTNSINISEEFSKFKSTPKRTNIFEEVAGFNNDVKTTIYDVSIYYGLWNWEKAITDIDPYYSTIFKDKSLFDPRKMLKEMTEMRDRIIELEEQLNNKN